LGGVVDSGLGIAVGVGVGDAGGVLGGADGVGLEAGDDHLGSVADIPTTCP